MTQQSHVPLIAPLDSRVPEIDEGAWVAPMAVVVGAVSVGAGASIWYGAVLRADDEIVSVGRDTNIQDGAVLHADPGYPCRLGDGVTVGHSAVVHGATVGTGTLVGMGSRVLNGAHIGERCLIAAGALVPEGFCAPDGVLILGSPARIRRELTPDELADIARTAEDYRLSARRHREAMSAHGP